MTHGDIIDTLTGLIKVCKDGLQGCLACAEHVGVGSPKLTALLSTCRRGYASAAEALQALSIEQGADSAKDAAGDATPVCALLRGEPCMRSISARMGEVAVLEACERVEERAKVAYQKALVKGLPSSVRAVVEQQYLGLLRNREQLRALLYESKHAPR